MNYNRSKIPRLIEWLLNILATSHDRDSIIHAYMDLYEMRREEKGSFNATLWLWGEILFSAPGLITAKISRSFTMLKNYFKIAMRNIKKQKLYSFINIFGLAIGIACFILIMLFVDNEFGYEKFHKNVDNIYKLTLEVRTDGNSSYIPALAYPVGPALKNNFPDILYSARTKGGNFSLKYKDNVYNERSNIFVDSDFFKIFTFNMIQGNPQTVLDDPGNVVISERKAKIIFGDEDPIGKQILLNNKYSYTVSGVVKLQTNTMFKSDIFLPFSTVTNFQTSFGDDIYTDWGRLEFQNYILVSDGSSMNNIEEKISSLLTDNGRQDQYIRLIPIRNAHLYNIDGSPGLLTLIYLCIALAAFILFIACINFMNLSTARFRKRSREVGLRKSIGAKRGQLIIQFLSESIFLTIISFTVSLVIVSVALPYFNNFVLIELKLDAFRSDYILFFVSMIIFTGVIAGSYPALYLSSFEPLKVLRGTISSSGSSKNLRKYLVVFQFLLSILLIVCTMTVSSQMNFISNKDLGLEKDNIIYTEMFGDSKTNHDSAKKELLTHQAILDVTTSFFLTSAKDGGYAGDLEWEAMNADQRVGISFSFIDADYLSTFNMKIVKGRDFSKEISADNTGFLVNEEAVRQMGLENPIGKSITMWGRTGSIIGVVKDFHYRHMNTKIGPLIMSLYNYGFDPRFLTVKYDPARTSEVIDHFRTVWNKHFPSEAFEYRFLEESYDEVYIIENKVSELLFNFSLLSIFISCLGLFGLSAFTAEERSKEISIRKVLGASITNITALLAKQYTVWVLIANLLAWPIGYYSMNIWLQEFAYRIELDLKVFLLSGSIALAIALLTISYQAIKTATSNPVDSLKQE